MHACRSTLEDPTVGTGELYGKAVAIVSAAPSPERGVNARRWVEEVVGYQGGQVVASFTVIKDDDPAAALTRIVDGITAATS